MDYIEELNSAIAEGRRRAAQVVEEVGNLDEQVLSPNERRRKQDLIDTARGKVSQLGKALTAVQSANREMERFGPAYVKFQAVSKRLTDMLTGESKDAQDVERILALKLCLSFIDHYICENPQCRHITKEPGHVDVRVSGMTRKVPYCPKCALVNGPHVLKWSPCNPPGLPNDYVGDDRSYPVTCRHDLRGPGRAVEQQRIRPYSTLYMLQEVDAALEGPRIDWKQGKSFAHYETRVKEAKKRIDGAVRSVRSLLDEMLTVQAAA